MKFKCVGIERQRTLSVVKLFNAIAESQSAIATVAEETRKSRGSGKPSLLAPSFEKGNSKKKGRQKDNLLGRGKEGQYLTGTLPSFFRADMKTAVSVDKEDFMEVIRSGVSIHV